MRRAVILAPVLGALPSSPSAQSRPPLQGRDLRRCGRSLSLLPMVAKHLGTTLRVKRLDSLYSFAPSERSNSTVSFFCWDAAAGSASAGGRRAAAAASGVWPR